VRGRATTTGDGSSHPECRPESVGRRPCLVLHRTAIIRLVGAVLAEQHDEWIEGRRYLGLDVLNRARATTISPTEEQPANTPP
jgi:hypothetical protein